MHAVQCIPKDMRNSILQSHYELQLSPYKTNGQDSRCSRVRFDLCAGVTLELACYNGVYGCSKWHCIATSIHMI